MKIMAPFVALLLIVLCAYACVTLIMQIWLQLLIIAASLGVVVSCFFLIWIRFRRW